MEKGQSKLDKLLEFQEKNTDYLFVKYRDDISDNNEYHLVSNGEFYNTCGITHYIRYGVAPINGIYSIPELNEFLEYLDKQTGFSLENGGSWNFNFSISKKLFSKGTFCRGERNICEHLDIKVSKINQLFLEINDKYILKHKEEELTALLSVEKNLGTNQYSKIINGSLPEKSSKRTINLRVFPDKTLMEINQSSKDSHYMPDFSYEDLKSLIGKENSDKLFRREIIREAC